jgi:diguanylate cyclase (GGDEF)-like protein/PAS domain S-box-containing protein
MRGPSWVCSDRRPIMQSSPNGSRLRISLTDPPRVLSVSDSIESLTGLAAEEWLSSRVSLRERVHPADIASYNCLVSSESSPARGTVSLRLRHADGRIRCVQAAFEKGSDNGHPVLDLRLEAARANITPALRSILDGLRALIDHTDDYMYVKDRNHVYVGASRRMTELLENPASPIDFIGKTGYDLYSEEMADDFFGRDQQVLAGGRATNEVQRLTLPNGSHRWIDNRKYPLKTENGEPIGLFGICPDITEPIEAEHELSQSRELFHLFIEHAPAALAMFDRDMRFIAVSNRWRRDFNLGSQDIIGRSHYEVFPDIPERWKVMHRRALEGEVLFCEEDRFVRADFTVQWSRWEIHPWRTAEGAVGGILIFAEDITQQRNDREQLQLAASVFTNAREGILICDPNGTILDVNEMFTHITGYTRAEAIGRNPRILQSGRQSPEFYQDMWRAVTENGHWSGEIWNKTKDGRIYPEMLTISAVCDRGSRVRHYVALFSDLTEAREQERQLERMAHFDALTNLPNRVLLVDRLQQAMAQAHRRGQLLAVACVDLDRFRTVNDRFGQEAGDHLLMAVARRMKLVLREADTLARVGGDEFIAVLLDLPDVEAARPTLDSLLACASEPEAWRGDTLQVSASIGVVFYPQTEPIDADQLLRQAGQAMYQSKLSGKNRYQIFDPSHDITVRTFHEDLEQIRCALVSGQFVLHYQPRVNMSTGELVGAEALIRWRHPTRGYLKPDLFLPVIENHHLVDRIGEWVIESALRQMETWHAGGLRIPVSVNIAAHHLQQPDFAERLRALLAVHPALQPSWLELEVLESSALHDVAQVSRVLAACREIGVSIALDDFGTGYSSLTYFKRLPVDMLKIDRSFVRDVLDDPEDLSILEGVLGLATAFDRMAIAEGVETVDQGRLLLQLGCVYGQGNGIAHPMPGDALPSWSAAWRPDPAWKNAALVGPRKRTLVHAAVAHRAWVTGVESFLLDRRAVPPVLDPHRCRFGRWFDSERNNSIGGTPAYRKIDELHQQIHTFAEQAAAGKTSATAADVDLQIAELRRVRDALLEQMNLLLQDAAS